MCVWRVCLNMLASPLWPALLQNAYEFFFPVVKNRRVTRNGNGVCVCGVCVYGVCVYVVCVYVLCVYVLCVYVLCVYVLCVYVLCVCVLASPPWPARIQAV